MGEESSRRFSLRRAGLRRRRWGVVSAIVVVTLVVAVIVADHVTLPYYAIQPGEAQAVPPLIHVPRSKERTVHGSILLTDVYLGPVTLLEAIPDLLSANTDLVPSSEVLGPATPPAELDAQGYLEMEQSQEAAKAVALRALGYRVPTSNAGALVFAVQPGSPASGVLKVAQIVKAVNGVPTPTACAFVSVLHPLAAGTTVHLAVEQSTVTPEAAIRPGPVVERSARLAAPSPQQGPTGCPGVTGKPKGFLGVSIETQQDFAYPFPVSVDTTDIGGPSAGLAMTLGIIDKLSTGRLTGGHVVAATGTIDTSGQIGDVSGVPQKTIAVERAGATVFLVPPEELGAAESKATPRLRVYAVSSLRQALQVLAHLGGALPAGFGGLGPR